MRLRMFAPMASAARAVLVKTAAVIGDANLQPRGGLPDAELDQRSVAVFEGIVKGFLDDQEQAVTGLRRQRAFWQVQRQLQPAAQTGAFEEFVGVAAHLLDQTVPGVMFGADRPDDFVHGTNRGPGEAGDLPNVNLNLLGPVLVSLRQIAEHGDAGEAGTQVVVDVPGDAGALLQGGFALGFLPDIAVWR